MKIPLQKSALLKTIVNHNRAAVMKKLLLLISGVFILHNSYALPIFSVIKTNVLAGDTVEFINESYPANITSWSWTFPGGTPATSTLKNPKVVYAIPGVYSMTLSYSIGSSFTTPVPLTKTDYITVSDATIGLNNAALVEFVDLQKVNPGLHDVKVRIRNMGENSINEVTINWELDGVVQPSISTLLYLDTLNGLLPRDIIWTLGSVMLLPGSSRSLKAWTTLPNSGIDPQTSNDTINFTIREALSGTYTIGGLTPDFKTINDAVRGLKYDYGIAGPVVFNIRNGTYIECISLDSIPSSSTKTILFKSENNDRSLVTMTFDSSEANYTIRIKNSNYISFKHLTITSTSRKKLASALFITQSSSFLLFEKCSFSMIADTPTRAVIFGGAVLTLSGSQLVQNSLACLSGSDLVFKNNVITGGNIGISLEGITPNASNPGITCPGIVIDSNYISGCLQPIRFYYLDAPKLINNTITGVLPSATRIVQLFHCQNGIEIINNKISTINLVSWAQGLVLDGSNGSNTNYIKIYNNEIVIRSSVLATASATSTTVGLSTDANFLMCFNNSIHNFSSHPAVTSPIISHRSTSYAAAFGSSDTTTILRNNIFANTCPGGAALLILSDPTSQFKKSNYNLLYSSATTGLIHVGVGAALSGVTAVYSSLNSFRSAYPFSGEKNSVMYRPAFTSNTNLAPNSSDTASWLMNGTGTALDGAPDMGAYQFTPTASAPKATPLLAASVAGQSQAFMYGNDTAAILQWDPGAITPATVEVTNYTDSAIADYPAQLQLRSFMKVTMMPPSSSYLYNIKYFYRTPLKGNITNEQDIAGAKLAGNNWFFYSGSSTILDTLNNTIKASSLSDNNFAFTGTDNWLPLPVKLLSFDAKVQSKDVLLSWSTASEKNCARFEVERSYDGHNFGKVGSINATGNSSKNVSYQYNDANIMSKAKSANIFYRLKMIDADGSSDYSNIAVINLLEKIQKAVVFPNPFVDDLTVSVVAKSKGIAQFSLHDITGKEAIRYSQDLIEGNNRINMNVPSLSTGLYFLCVEMDGEKYIVKVIRQ
jgi:hypothetical protein